MKTKLKQKTGYFLLTVAAVFIILGIIRQEHSTVFTKSSSICLECIGIG